MQRIFESTYDKVTLNVSRDVINRFKQFLSDEEIPGAAPLYLGSYSIFGIELPILVGFVEGNRILVQAEIRFKKEDIHHKEPRLNLILMYRPYSIMQDFNTIVTEIKSAVRHELEHMGQIYKSNKTKIDWYNPASEPVKKGTDEVNPKLILKYYLLPHEIEAHVKGLLRQAKSRRILLQDQIEEFVSGLSELSKLQKQKVKKAYLKYAADNNLLRQKPISKTYENTMSNNNGYVVSFSQFQKLDEKGGSGLKALVGKEGGEELNVQDAKRIAQKISGMKGKMRQKYIGIVNFMGASCKIFNTIWANYKPVDKNRKAENTEKEYNKPVSEPTA